MQDDPAVDSVVGFTGGRQTNSGFVYISLKPFDRAKDHRRRRRHPAARQARGGGRRAAVPGRGFRFAHRRAAEQRHLSIHAALGRHGAALRMDAQADGGVARRSGRDRRQLRPAAGRPGDRRDDRPGDGDAPRPHLERDRQHALRRLRAAPGLDDLQRAQPVSRRAWRSRRAIGRIRARCKDLWVSTSGANPSGAQQTNTGADLFSAATAATSTAAQIAANSARNLATNSLAASGHTSASAGAAVSSAAETMIPLAAVAHFARGQTPLSVNHQGQFAASTISFNLAEGHALERSARRDRGGGRAHRHALDRSRRLRRHRGDVPAVAVEYSAALRRRHRDDLYRARHSLREPHPSDHDSLDPVFGQRRRGARASASSTPSSPSSRRSAFSC